ncbi:MAG TPA: hypothetical protein PKA21_08990 [Kiritimatiellia bacterium]|nr:hypothetical protein [Kiritimatiellia bacterium]HMP35011.1 hypothetical protein [Kiritimatiellia bacterium]
MNTLRLLSNSIRVVHATPICNSSSPMTDAQRRAIFASMRATGRPHAGRGTPSGVGAHVVKQGQAGDLAGATRFAPKADPSQGEWLTYTAGSSAFAKGNISYAHNDVATLQSLKDGNPEAWSNLVAQYPSLKSVMTNRSVSDAQRRAIFAKLKGGSGGRSSSSGGPDSGTTSTSRSHSDSFQVMGNKLTMSPELMAAAYGGNSKQQQYDMMKAMPPKPSKRYTGPDAIRQMERDNKAWLEQWGKNMAKLAQARVNTASAPVQPVPPPVTPAATATPPPSTPAPAANNSPSPNAASVPVATPSARGAPTMAVPSVATPAALAPVAAPSTPAVQSSLPITPVEYVPVRNTNVEELARLASIPGPNQAMYQNLLTQEQSRQAQAVQAGRPYIPSSQLTPQSPEWRDAKSYEQQVGLDEYGRLISNSGRSVSEMPDDQRKAVMAKLGGGGGAARGYTGGARGGKRGPARNPVMYVTPEGNDRAVRDAQIGIHSDLTPFDLFVSSAIEEGLDGISLARMNTDNKWVDAALGVAALGLFAAGVKNARTQKALTQHMSAQKHFNKVLEQMSRDAERFKPLLEPAGSSVGDDIYRTYDKIAERVTRARGYPPTDVEATRWLDKVAPRVDTIPPSRTGDIFRSEAARESGSRRAQLLDYARRADLDAISPRMVKDPWRSISDVIGESGIGNRSALQLIRAAVNESVVLCNAGPMSDEQRKAMFAKMGGTGGGSFKPGSRVRPATLGPSKRNPAPMTYNPKTGSTSTSLNPSTVGIADLGPYRETGGIKVQTPDDYLDYIRIVENPRRAKQGLPPVSEQEIADYIAQHYPDTNPENRPIPPAFLPPGLRLVSNAVRVANSHFLISNAGPMSDEQRKAMFAKSSGPGGRGVFAKSRPGPSTVSRAPISTSTLPLYTRTDMIRIDQGVGLPGSERPSRTMNLSRFDQLFESFKSMFPNEQGGIAYQMDVLLRPFRENPSAFFADPKAVDQLYKMIAPAVSGNTSSKNYETKRSALESSFYSEGLKILQAAGLMPGWVAHSTFGKDGFQGVRFWNERPAEFSAYPASYVKSGSASSLPTLIKRSVSGGGISPSRAGSYPAQAPRTPSGGYAPREAYPGGPVFYGPKPGEQGYIDIGQWRKGAQPQLPNKPGAKPSPIQQTDRK